MPKLGASMETGTILQWFKEEGDSVEVGDVLLEIMTDKINMEIEAEVSGVLLKQLYADNEEVPVHQPIAYIGEAGEKPSENSIQESNVESVEGQQVENVASVDDTSDATKKVRATPAARKLMRDRGLDIRLVAGTGPKGRIQLADAEAYAYAGKISATPLAEKIAHTEKVDLASVSGTGVRGKVMSQDVRSHRESTAQQRASSVESVTKVRMEGIRKVVAKRMVESAFTAPHVTLVSEVDMTNAKHVREQLLPMIEQQTGNRLSYTEIIIKAVAHCLKKHPTINSSLQDDHILLHSQVNIGIAVAAPSGLIVPVVKNCDEKGLAELTTESKMLGRVAREGKLSLDQMSEGTFTISNLGMYAIDSFTSIINQPESAILGVARIAEKPVVVNNAIVSRSMMTMSLSIDHRVIDGAPAAAFLTELKETLENPLVMLA